MIEILRGKVFRDGKELKLSPRRLALLVSLARRCGGVPRGRLLEELWPDLDGDAAINAFNVCLCHVRRLLGDEGVVQEGGSYRLGDGLRVDLHEIEAAIVAIRRKQTLSDKEYAELRAIGARLQVPRPSVYADWVWFEETERRLDTLLADTGTILAREALRRERPDDALEFARMLLERDPCDETAQEIKIGAYLALGDEPAAFRAYRRYRDTLARELGVEPSRSLRQMIAGRFVEDKLESAEAPTEVESDWKVARPTIGDGSQRFPRESSVLKKILLAASLLSLALGAAAGAGPRSLQQEAAIAITPSCSLSKPATGGDFKFSSVSGLYSGAVTTTATLEYQCSVGVLPTLAMSDGNVTGGSYEFAMTGTRHGGKIPFAVYLGADAGGSPIANSASGGLQLPQVTSTAQGMLEFFASASVPTNAVPDRYTDLITTTLNF